jgi:hypothetical protein
MPWIRPRDHLDFYHDILYHHWKGDHINTEWMQDHAEFQNIMLEHYGIEVDSGPVGPDRRFYLDDRNHILFLLRWA